MMDRVRNRKPEDAHEIKQEVRELSKLVDVRKEIKELQEQLARLIAELGEQQAEKDNKKGENELRGDPEIDAKIKALRKHNAKFTLEIKTLMKRLKQKKRALGMNTNEDSQCCSIF